MPAPANTTAATTTTATPESAPVLEFRCLFSRDGHKKRKTFHDGTLKFHAFNARVMVYDLDRHYVGDLHYRSDDDFAEGLELRLDSGVVVQVQDLLGQTQTPLDQVLCYKNKKATPGDNVTNSISTPAVTSSSSRASAGGGGGGGGAAATATATATRRALRPIPAVSHQRPRSLKDVLAVSQPPSSRPRAHVLTLDRQRPPSDQPPRKKLKPTVAVVSNPAEDTATSLPFQDVVDLSSDDEQPPPQPRKVMKQTPSRPQQQQQQPQLGTVTKQTPSRPQQQQQQPQLGKVTKQTPSRPQQQQQQPQLGKVTKQTPSRPQQQQQQPQLGKVTKQTPSRPQPQPQPPARSPVRTPKVPLCLPPPKPRPKLMCRAALAPSRKSPPHSPPRRDSPRVEVPSSPGSPITRPRHVVQTSFPTTVSPGRFASSADAAFPRSPRSRPALMKATSAPPHVPSHQSLAQESSGPWTPQEAFLLFDWWPADRTKPKYGTDG